MSVFSDLRLELGLSESQVREFLCLPAAKFSAYESGVERPSVREIQALRGFALARPTAAAIMPKAGQTIFDFVSVPVWRTEDKQRLPSRKKMTASVTPPIGLHLVQPNRPERQKKAAAFTFIDLFAGIGGLRRGFETIGGKCSFTCEWDRYSQKTYQHNFSEDVHEIAGDIREVEAKDIPEHDVLLAGFPCQPFSIAGVSKKNALNRPHGFACEAQGTLFFEVCRIISHHRPRVFLLENVKNLVNHNSGRTFSVIRGVLEEELGYHIKYKIIDAKSWVPQHRERIFIAGSSAPEMFFAYNNGITATASSVELDVIPNGTAAIRSIRNLQIVNGGQTTASILYARDQVKVLLDRVFVQMKLSVVKPELVEEIVPRISKYANTQNKVSEADFFASHPFHIAMEKISRRLSAPPKLGSLSPSKWFYERARGQYRDQLAYGTATARRKFELEFPKDQVVDKTAFAKFRMTFDCKPHIVSRAAQKCFLAFADLTDKAWQASDSSFNDDYFKRSMAQAMIFRQTDRMVGTADWYQSDRGYKSQIVTYTIAWLVNRLARAENAEINLLQIWNRQEVPEALCEILGKLTPQVAITLKDAPPQVRNIGEYCKLQLCWAKVWKVSLCNWFARRLIHMQQGRSPRTEKGCGRYQEN